jgi:hypothetical protein
MNGHEYAQRQYAPQSRATWLEHRFLRVNGLIEHWRANCRALVPSAQTFDTNVLESLPLKTAATTIGA